MCVVSSSTRYLTYREFILMQKYAHKKIKELKPNIKDSHQIIKEEYERNRKEEKRTIKQSQTINKMLYIPINNYL